MNTTGLKCRAADVIHSHALCLSGLHSVRSLQHALFPRLAVPAGVQLCLGCTRTVSPCRDLPADCYSSVLPWPDDWGVRPVAESATHNQARRGPSCRHLQQGLVLHKPSYHLHAPQQQCLPYSHRLQRTCKQVLVIPASACLVSWQLVTRLGPASSCRTATARATDPHPQPPRVLGWPTRQPSCGCRECPPRDSKGKHLCLTSRHSRREGALRPVIWAPSRPLAAGDLTTTLGGGGSMSACLASVLRSSLTLPLTVCAERAPILMVLCMPLCLLLHGQDVGNSCRRNVML